MSVDYIDPSELYALLESKPGSVTVVDVRDEDRDGYISSSIHFPSRGFSESSWKDLGSKVATPIVVFHCMFSQVRGPKAARMFLPYASPSVEKVLILRGGWIGFYMNVASQMPAAQKLCTIPPNYVPQF